MKRVVIAFAALTLMISPGMAQKIGVAMSLFDDVLLATHRRNLDRMANEAGVEIQFEDGQGDIGRQMSQVQNFIAEGMDVIIINPVDPAATPRMTKLVTEAGIPLVYFSRAPQEAASGKLPEGVYYIGADENTSGTEQAKAMAKMMNDKGKVAILMGQLGDNATNLRTAGEEKVFGEYPDIEIVEKQSAMFMRTDAMNLVRNWIVGGVKMDAIAANNDEMAIGAIMALEQSGTDPKPLVIGGVDGTPDALQHIKDGTLDVTMFQASPAISKGTFDVAMKVAKGEKAEQFTWIPFKVITKDNYEEFMGKQE